MIAKSKQLLRNSLSIEAGDEVLKSQWQRVERSFIYLLYRWSVFFFFAFALGFSAIMNIDCGHFHVFFIYLTHLNFCGTVATLCLGAFLVTLFYFNKFSPENKFWPRVYWLLWNQSIVLSCIISVFYWAVIYKGQPIDVNNVFIHITNSAVLIFDLFLVRHPSNFKAVIFLLPVEVSYAIFTVLYQLLGGLDKNGDNFVYAASDWKNHPFRSLFFFTCLATFSIILHFTINFCHLIRVKLHGRICLQGSQNSKVSPADVQLEIV